MVPGCPMCRKRFGTMPQFLDHLTDDVLPTLLDRLSSEARVKMSLDRHVSYAQVERGTSKDEA